MIDLIWEHRDGRETSYPGAFPRGFEKRLWMLVGEPNPSEIIHLFGGSALIGLRCDINSSTHPDVLSDAHILPFRDESFSYVVCDPPFSDRDNRTRYGNHDTPPLDQDSWMREAVRVLKKDGFLATRHIRDLPAPQGFTPLYRIVLKQCKGREDHVIQVSVKGRS